MNVKNEIKIDIPAEVGTLIDELNAAGFEAFAVGGCVRDSIMGKVPRDWDICTSAEPCDMHRVFSHRRVIETGIRHGTLTVFADDAGHYEITTYRVDGEYRDNRHPESVTFTKDINSDLARRDFTINAIAYNYTKGLVDPFEGIEDIGRKMIRCVGDPGKRFDEDALRIMRCIRFASELGFDIDSSTAYSAAVKKKLLHNISAERIRIEFNKLLCGEGATQVMRTYRDIVAEVVPEIRAAFDFDQRTPYHIYDVWEHTLRVLYHTEPDIKLKLIAFFHDLGKPEMFTIRNGRGHFYRHEKVSEEIARTVLARLKYDNDTIYHVCSVIRNHSIIFQRSAKQARRLLLKLGEEDLRMLIKLECADVKGQNPAFRDDRMALISDFSKILDMVIGASQCFSTRDMAINGNDLIDIGIRQGPEIGRILKKLLDMIIEEEINNDRDILLLKAREIAGKS